VALAAFVALAPGCSPYHEVSSAADLDRSERALVVEVMMEGDDVSDRVSGMYLGSNLVVDDEIPMSDGKPAFNAMSGHEVDSGGFGAKGGVVALGAGRGTFYILGIRASSTSILWNTTTFLPLVVRVPPALGRCEYVGTIHVRPGRPPVVRDEFDQKQERLARTVTGCHLTRNIGATLIR
jgi:hypothetical protein